MKRLAMVLLLLTGCVANMDTAPSAAPPMDAEAAIQARNSQFVLDWKARDAQNLASNYYAEDVIVLPPNAPTARGREAAAAFMKGLFDTLDATSIQLITENVVQEGNLAYEVGRFHMSMTPKGSSSLVTDDGKYVVVWRRGSDGQWRAVVDAFSSNQPAAH